MLHYKNKCTSYVSLALIHCITVVIILVSFRKISLLKRKDKKTRDKREIDRHIEGRTDGRADRQRRKGRERERETEREKVLKRQVTL